MTPKPAPPQMTLEIEDFTRKPFDVQGVKITPRNMAEVAKWCGGKMKAAGQHDGRIGPYIKVNVNNPLFERQTQAFVGDYVLWSETGGYKVYTEKALEKSFIKKPKRR